MRFYASRCSLSAAVFRSTVGRQKLLLAPGHRPPHPEQHSGRSTTEREERKAQRRAQRSALMDEYNLRSDSDSLATPRHVVNQVCRISLAKECPLCPQFDNFSAEPSACEKGHGIHRGGIQVAAIRPGEIATGIDPGAIRAAMAEGPLPSFSHFPLNSTVSNCGQHSRAWPPMMDSAWILSRPQRPSPSLLAAEEIPQRRTQCFINSRMPSFSLH